MGMFAIALARSGLWRRRRHDLGSQLRIRRQHAVEPYQVQSWPWHQRRQPLHELHRCQHDVGGAVAPRGFQFEDDVAVAVDGQAFVGDRRTRDVAGAGDRSSI